MTKNFKPLIAYLLSIIALSCSTENEKNPIKPKMKKLMRVNVNQPRLDYEKECSFNYNSDNRISEINETTTYNKIQNTTKINFNYQNDTIVSAKIYSTENIVYFKKFNYSNGNLAETITYTTEGVEKSRNEYLYSSNKKVISFKKYQENQLIVMAENMVYGIDENIAGVEGKNVSFEFDRNPSPYEYLSYTDKIIFSIEASPYDIFSKNNLIRQEFIGDEDYLNGLITITEVAIQYDSDNYPIIKKSTLTANGQKTDEVSYTYSYE